MTSSKASEVHRYKPEQYWQKRFSNDFTLREVGSIGLGYEYNKWLYKARVWVLSRLLRKHKINLHKKRILDIGCGTGFYMNYWEKWEVGSVMGLDITKKSVKMLEKKFPKYKFLKADISSSELNIDGKFDIITAFDVLFMNSPIDKNNLKNDFVKMALPKIWSIISSIISKITKLGIIGKIINHLMGAILFTMDRVVLRYVKAGPSTKLMLIEVN